MQYDELLDSVYDIERVDPPVTFCSPIFSSDLVRFYEVSYVDNEAPGSDFRRGDGDHIIIVR